MGYDKQTLNKIYEKKNGYCHLCGKKLSRTNYGSNGSKGAWHVDHSKAKANGGTNHMNNLFAACIGCNIEKGTLHKTTIRKRKNYGKEESSGGGCYITTACVVSKGLKDDCIQLKVLRNFRDTFVSSMPKGQEMINEYYKTAPLIIAAIDKRNNASEIYSQLLNRIETAVLLVKRKSYLAAFRFYCEIANDLKAEYLNIK